LAAHLYNASFKIEDDDARMRVLERTMALAPPPLESGPHRQAFTMSFNNACILAHAKKDFRRARDIAERAQAYVTENPYIYHAAACAYAAAGDLEVAFEQVKGAVSGGYDHLDKLEKDTDLGQLLEWPKFKELFAAWRVECERSEPVVE